MKYSEINKLTTDELKTKINSLKKDLFNFPGNKQAILCDKAAIY